MLQCPQPPDRLDGHVQPPSLLTSIVMRPLPPTLQRTTSWPGAVIVTWESSVLVDVTQVARHGTEHGVFLSVHQNNNNILHTNPNFNIVHDSKNSKHYIFYYKVLQKVLKMKMYQERTCIKLQESKLRITTPTQQNQCKICQKPYC